MPTTFSKTTSSGVVGWDMLPDGRCTMNDADAVLDQLQNAYKAAVDAWVTTIRAEEQLASVHHTVAEVDKWENAHFLAEDARSTAKAAKAAYEGALRKRLFGF